MYAQHIPFKPILTLSTLKNCVCLYKKNIRGSWKFVKINLKTCLARAPFADCIIMDFAVL